MTRFLDRRRWFREVLRTTGAALGARVALPALLVSTGCGGDEESEDAEASKSLLRVPTSEIPAEGRIVREHLEVPVEFRREDGAVVATSMFCSHQMCRLEWKPDDERYYCPCHDGLFDARGEVIYGPPRRPLRRLPVEHDGDAVVVDVYEVYRAASTRPKTTPSN